MWLLVALNIVQGIWIVILLLGIHPAYGVAIFAVATEAAWTFGIATPWLNCFTLALFERLRLGCGRVAIRDGHYELRIGDRAIGWVPSSKGWRRTVSRRA